MKIIKLVAILVATASLFACNNGKSGKTLLKTKKDSASYALGSLQAKGFVRQITQMQAMQYIDKDRFLTAINEATEGKAIIDNSKALNVIQSTFRKIQLDSTFKMPDFTKGAELQNIADTLSYAFGTDMSERINKGIEDLQMAKEVNMKALLSGITDVVKDSSILSENVERTLVTELVQKSQQAKAQANEAKYAENKKAGIEFLEKNKERSEVKVTESGLQYEIIKEGTGASPTDTDKVKVHYHGTLIDGTVFDSSVERGEPITFPLNRVISGWTEGLQLMKEGAKFKFYIPQELAYGASDKGNIKPYSTLIFEVELFEVEK